MKTSIKRFFTLVNFEINRLSKFLIGLIGLTALFNLFGAFRLTQNHMDTIQSVMDIQNIPFEEAIASEGRASLSDVFYSDFFLLPLLIGVAFFCLYLFFIWYREWFGKNTFAYCLMMLPMPRMAIFFSKVCALFIGMWSIVSVQYILLILSRMVLAWQLPELAYSHQSLQEALFQSHDRVWTLILGGTIGDFVFFYGLSLVFILCLFTVILLERCFKLTGIILGGIYLILCTLALFFIFFLPELFNNHYMIFDTEMFAMILGVLLLIVLSSLLISRYLMNRQLTI